MSNDTNAFYSVQYDTEPHCNREKEEEENNRRKSVETGRRAIIVMLTMTAIYIYIYSGEVAKWNKMNVMIFFSTLFSTLAPVPE